MTRQRAAISVLALLAGISAGSLVGLSTGTPSVPTVYALTTYCPEPDNSPFFTDSQGPVFDCDSLTSLEIYITGGSSCPGSEYQIPHHNRLVH